LSSVLTLVLLNTKWQSLTLLQVPQLTENFQVLLANTTGEAQLGDDVEATLIVRNHNFAIYFNGFYSLLYSVHWWHG